MFSSLTNITDSYSCTRDQRKNPICRCYSSNNCCWENYKLFSFSDYFDLIFTVFMKQHSLNDTLSWLVYCAARKANVFIMLISIWSIFISYLQPNNIPLQNWEELLYTLRVMDENNKTSIIGLKMSNCSCWGEAGVYSFGTHLVHWILSGSACNSLETSQVMCSLLAAEMLLSDITLKQILVCISVSSVEFPS